MSAPVCKFFLQGRCKYGSSCHYSHAGVHNKYSLLGDQRKTPDASDILDGMVNDFKEAEAGKMYPLSAYGIQTARFNMPGQDDLSPEEIHWKAKTCKENNQWDVYVKDYETRKNDSVNMRSTIVRLSQVDRAGAVNAVKNMVEKGSVHPTQVTTQSTFGSSTQTSKGLFGKPPSSVFGGSNTSSGSTVFGGTTLAATQKPTSLFGTDNSTAQAKSVFGGTQSTGIVQPSSTFGSNQSTQSKSIFGGNTAQGQASSVFGSTGTQPSRFGTTQQISALGSSSGPSGLFGKPATPAQVFGGPSSSQASIFNKPPATSQATPASVFGNKPPATSQATPASVFGNKPSATSQATPASVFGNKPLATSQATPASVFGNKPPAKSQATPASVFGGNVKAGSIFGGSPSAQQPTPASVFGSKSAPTQQVTPASVFGKGAAEQTPASTGTGLFGKPSLFSQPGQKQSTLGESGQASSTFRASDSLFGKSQGVELTVESLALLFSKEVSLTDNELEAFRSDSFTLASLPMHLPPKSLCN